MKNSWILLNGEQKGPYTWDQLSAMWKSGAITADTQYWTEGAADWKAIAERFSESSTDQSAPQRVTRYFYSQGGEDVQGPVSSSDILQMHSAKLLSDDAQVCKEGDEVWRPIRESGILPKYPHKKANPSSEPAPATVLAQPIPKSRMDLPNKHEVDLLWPFSRLKPSASHAGIEMGSPKHWVIFGGVIFVAIILLGFLHIVTNDGLPVCVVAKEHFSYSMTLVSVDEITDRYNNRSIAGAMHGDPLLDHLVDELGRRGIITERKRTWDEINQRVRDELPDK